MKAVTKSNIFYIFPLFLIICACIGTSSIPQIDPTLVPSPSDTPTVEPIVTSEPIASPTREAGSFADFQLFAAGIAAALQDENVSFFDEHLATSSWLCLGEPETVGVCQDVPADTTLEGVPVAHDWATYEVYSREDYRQRWQTTFADGSVLKLAALAQLFGQNPLMPMASQASLAIIAVPEDSDPSSVHEVRVLFFEYYYDQWRLAGELVAIERAEAWLNDTCDMCYDTWAAWQQ